MKVHLNVPREETKSATHFHDGDEHHIGCFLPGSVTTDWKSNRCFPKKHISARLRSDLSQGKEEVSTSLLNQDGLRSLISGPRALQSQVSELALSHMQLSISTFCRVQSAVSLCFSHFTASLSLSAAVAPLCGRWRKQSEPGVLTAGLWGGFLREAGVEKMQDFRISQQRLLSNKNISHFLLTWRAFKYFQTCHVSFFYLVVIIQNQL